ncbi:MAG: hypothetical protein JEY99_18175 [Spirochaetales bacterium]|nr:hypothetical protein [Spirochaetales bacterium]
MYLYAISLPGNIEAEISALKRTLFSSTGNVSLFAFPQVIPIMFSAKAPSEAFLNERNRRKVIPPSSLAGFMDSAICDEGGVLSFSGSVPGWEEISTSLRSLVGEDSGEFKTHSEFFRMIRDKGIVDRSARQKEILFSVPEIFIGYSDIQEKGSLLSSKLPTLTIRWKRGDLICYSIETGNEQAWWEQVSFNEIL